MIILLIPDLLTLLHVKSPCFLASTPISSKNSNYLRSTDVIETHFWRFYKNFPVPRPTIFTVVTPCKVKFSTKKWPKTSSETQLQDTQDVHPSQSPSSEYVGLPSLCRRRLSRRSSTTPATRPVSTHQGPLSRFHALYLPWSYGLRPRHTFTCHLHCTSPRL
jgi:hypothetical protein